MNLNTIINYLGILGIGGILGILIKSFLDKRLKEKELLFQARVNAYRGISGRMLNLFNELDLNSLPEPVRVSRIHNLMSELYLVGSKNLVDLLGDYKKVLFEFHNELEEVLKNKKKDETKCKELHSQLAKKTAELSI